MNAQSELQRSLAKFEKFLETPVIPGERNLWLKTVKEAAQGIDQQLRDQIHVVHPRKFQNIGQFDPGLLHRVERLKKSDDENFKLWETFRQKLAPNKDDAQAHAGDESPVLDDVSESANEGFHVIVEIRKQEEAILTWMGEAANRDRGTLD